MGGLLGFALDIALALDWWAGNDEHGNHDHVLQITNIHAYIYVCMHICTSLVDT